MGVEEFVLFALGILFTIIILGLFFVIPLRLLGLDLEEACGRSVYCGFFSLLIGVFVSVIILGIIEDTEFSIARFIGLKLDSTPTANSEMEFFLGMASGPLLVAGIIIIVLIICVLVRFIRKIIK